MIKTIIHTILYRCGLQVKRFSDSDLGRRMLLIKTNKINKIIDVGANIGQYGIGARAAGFKGEIISFEPLSDAFLKLKNKAEGDKKWEVKNCAIGNIDGNISINIAGNSVSSSISNMLETHLNAAPDSKYVGQETVAINKLDSLISDLHKEDDRIMLKIDTQGFEKNVLEGAEKFLDKVVLLQLEMSLVPLYDNEVLFIEMIDYLKVKGFEMVSIENGFYDKNSGKLFQVDGIFLNKRFN